MKISADSKKTTSQSPTIQPSTIKILKLGTESNVFNIMKANILNGKRLKKFLL